MHETVPKCVTLCAVQVQPYRDLTAALEDFSTLKALHYDDERQQFLDYGDHSEDVSLQVGCSCRLVPP